MNKPKKKKKVSKAMSPEELTLLSNVQSILDELTQMGAGGSVAEEVAPGPDEDEEILAAEGEMEEEEFVEEETEGKEVKMILKTLEETSSEGETASDDAEERMDEVQSELSEENLADVAKALLLLVKGGAVRKSAPKKVSPLEQVLSEIVKIQKAQQESVQDLNVAFGHILDGFGITQQLEVAKAAQTPAPRKINKAANDEVLEVLREALGVQKSESPEREDPQDHSNSTVVRKNLASRDILMGMVGPRR